MKGRRRNYDYNTKPRNWQKDRTRARWLIVLMLVVGLGIAGYVVYLAVVK